MRQIGLVGLIKIELPGQVVRLCAGGFFVWQGETYLSRDAVFGSVNSVQAIEEGVDGQVPSGAILFQPASLQSAATLSNAAYQGSRVRLWLAEYSPVTGQIIGAPDLEFDGIIDQTTLIVGKSRFELEMTIVSASDRLFERNIGNTLNPAWHKDVWPGETGHDNATGLGVPVAWGVEAPVQTAAYAYNPGLIGGYGGFNGAPFF